VVLFPALAKIQEERGRFRAAFRKALLGMSIVGFPLFATLIVLGGPIILVLYGPRWAPAVLPFQILCASGPLRMAGVLCTSAIDACGNLRQDLWRRFVGLGILVVLVLVGARWGLEGVALAVLTTNVITFTLLVTLLHRVTPLQLTDVLKAQVLPAGATVLLVGAELAFLLTGHRRGWPELVTLLVAAPAGFSAYALGLYLFRTTSLTALWRELTGDIKGVLPWGPEARRKA
jgi:O-antigen/teichoic acid export membrane protein